MSLSRGLAFTCCALGLLAAKGLVVDHDKSVLMDELGRQRFYHGVNIVEKSAPFHPGLDQFAPENIDLLHSMGASVVRLGVMMPGMFPTGNSTAPELNTTYLATVKEIVDRLHANGIGTILDLHQDTLAPKICGEGTPDWMLDVGDLHALPFPLPLTLFPRPIDPTTGHPKSCEPIGLLKFIGWSEFYMTDQSGKAFGQLYNGVGAMAAAFESFWKTVATEFKGHPGVVAYELLNEPWVGDHVGDPLLLLEAGQAEKKGVGTYMQRMHDVVKAADPDTLILYAPAEVNNRAMRHVGYEHGFLPDAAMAYHVYCVVGTDSGGPTNPISKELCHFNDGFSMQTRQDDLHRLQTAGFVTEFGGVSGDADGLAEVEFILQHFDAMQPPTSWAFWDISYISGTDNATRQAAYLKVLSRPYPRAVAGDLQSISFDSSSAEFVMTYTPANATNVTTEVFLPKVHYPAGYSVTISPSGAVNVVDTSFGVNLTVSSALNVASPVTVKVVPTSTTIGDIFL